MKSNYGQRRSIRLREFDYSSAGAYFVTLCAFERMCLFGEIDNDQIKLSQIGEIVNDCWLQISSHFRNADLDEYVIMPNHLHGIIVLFADAHNRAEHVQPLQNESMTGTFQHKAPKSVGSILGSFKAAVTRLLRANGMDDAVWQRNYYEHIVRNENELNRIRQYIIENPLHWESDRENPYSRNFNLGHDKYFSPIYSKS